MCRTRERANLDAWAALVSLPRRKQSDRWGRTVREGEAAMVAASASGEAVVMVVVGGWWCWWWRRRRRRRRAVDGVVFVDSSAREPFPAIDVRFLRRELEDLSPLARELCKVGRKFHCPLCPCVFHTLHSSFPSLPSPLLNNTHTSLFAVFRC